MQVTSSSSSACVGQIEKKTTFFCAAMFDKMRIKPNRYLFDRSRFFHISCVRTRCVQSQSDHSGKRKKHRHQREEVGEGTHIWVVCTVLFLRKGLQRKSIFWLDIKLHDTISISHKHKTQILIKRFYLCAGMSATPLLPFEGPPSQLFCRVIVRLWRQNPWQWITAYKRKKGPHHQKVNYISYSYELPL